MTSCKRRVESHLGMLTAYQVLRPNFEETLHFLYAISYCKHEKSLSEAMTISHTNVSLGDNQEMVSTGRLLILKSYE